MSTQQLHNVDQLIDSVVKHDVHDRIINYLVKMNEEIIIRELREKTIELIKTLNEFIENIDNPQ